MLPLKTFKRLRAGRVWTACGFSTTALLGVTGTWKLSSRNCYFEPFEPENDPLFQSHYFHKFNPGQHPSLNDTCVRKVALSDIEAELVDDALKNGSLLTERFCAGVWEVLVSASSVRCDDCGWPDSGRYYRIRSTA